MESHEVLRRALRKTSPKAVAADLGVSLSLVYKWAERPTEDGSGSRNPLDRLLQVIELSDDNGIIDWLCRRRGGHFVKDPDVNGHQIDHVLPATQEIIGHFSDLLAQISDAADDHSVSPDEADETLPAASVALAVTVWLPSDSAELVIDQLPLPSALVLPSDVLPSVSYSVTVLFASAVPVKVGVVSLVMSSLEDEPLSVPDVRSGADGAPGAEWSSE